MISEATSLVREQWTGPRDEERGEAHPYTMETEQEMCTLGSKCRDRNSS